jgi:hypothetical protein
MHAGLGGWYNTGSAVARSPSNGGHGDFKGPAHPGRVWGCDAGGVRRVQKVPTCVTMRTLAIASSAMWVCAYTRSHEVQQILSMPEPQCYYVRDTLDCSIDTRSLLRDIIQIIWEKKSCKCPIQSAARWSQPRLNMPRIGTSAQLASHPPSPHHAIAFPQYNTIDNPQPNCPTVSHDPNAPRCLPPTSPPRRNA